MIKNEPMTLRVSPKAKEAILQLANRQGISVSATIRRAVDEYIHKRRDLFKEDTSVR